MDHSQMQKSEEPPATEQPMSELDHAAMGHAMPQAAEPVPDQQPMSGMDHAAMGRGTMPPADESPAQQPMSGTDHVAMGHAMPQASADADPFYAPGSGLTPRAANGGKFLSRSEEHTSELQSLMRISYA